MLQTSPPPQSPETQSDSLLTVVQNHREAGGHPDEASLNLGGAVVEWCAGLDSEAISDPEVIGEQLGAVIEGLQLPDEGVIAVVEAFDPASDWALSLDGLATAVKIATKSRTGRIANQALLVAVEARGWERRGSSRELVDF